MAERRYIGVLLAAGKSSRMGRTKQLMPWDGAEADAEAQASSATRATTLVEASFDTIFPHCAQMIVVFGHDAPLVIDALHPRTFEIVISDPDAEMLHSLQLGLIEAQRIGDGRGVLLHLADVPGVSQQTVEQVIAAAEANSGKAVMPEHKGRGGHPVLIPPKLIHPIVTWKGKGGLREFWQQRAADVVRLPVEDRAVIRDLDRLTDFKTE